MNADPSPPSFSSDWSFYVIGLLLVLLGIAFILVPLLGRSVAAGNVKIPWLILYVYNKGGFVTSPLLVIISLIGILIALIIRR